MYIEAFGFGYMTIDGQTFCQDVKIGAQQITHPWWRKSGHQVLIQDVQDLLQHGVKVLLLGQGQPGMMRASDELRAECDSKGIELIQCPTAQAVDRFNQLMAGEAEVGAGFHLTC